MTPIRWTVMVAHLADTPRPPLPPKHRGRVTRHRAPPIPEHDPYAAAFDARQARQTATTEDRT